MFEHIKRAFNDYRISFWINVVSHSPHHFAEVLHINLFIDDNYGLCETHLSHTPQGIHNLSCMTGVALVNRNNCQVMEHPFKREIHIDYFRKLFF